jgi:hypothetical protein
LEVEANRDGRVGVQRLVALIFTTLAIAGCSPVASSAVVSPSAVGSAPVAATPSRAIAPSANLDSHGIMLVAVDEQVQAVLPTEELKMAFSQGLELAQANGTDLGYPWFDASTGQLVLSAVTPRGRALVDAAAIKVPHRIRVVGHGATELRHIQDDVTFLRSRGVPDAQLIYATSGDHRDNRTLIVISATSPALLEALAGLYPPDALAVGVNPAGTG